MAWTVVGEAAAILAGVGLLVAGAWLVVASGSALARRWGISPLWIGLTVVALGTSAPELVVSVIASLRGLGSLAVGTVVGSNLLNVLVVLGVTAAIAPVPLAGATIKRDLGLVAVASVGVWLLAADGVIHRGEGFLLLAMVPAYLAHAYREERRGWLPTPSAPEGFGASPVVVQWLVLVGGLAALVAGAWRLVSGASALAATVGVSERVIGLTVVAIGSSMPEMATSLVAAGRKKVDLALGNLIGSNLLNLLVVLGAAGAVRALPVSPLLWRLDMPLMIASALLVLRFAVSRGRVSRFEGLFLVGLYVLYLSVLLGDVVR